MDGSSIFLTIFLLASMSVIAFFALAYLFAVWRIFHKGGQPGWASLIPIYNIYIFLKIVGRPGWWLFLLFIPIVGVVISLIMALDLAKVFGKSAIFGFFLLWLFPIGYLILGLGSARYMGPSSPQQPADPAPAQVAQPAPVPVVPPQSV
jgi:hypothetical protein